MVYDFTDDEKEAFFEQYFDYGDDIDTYKSNLSVSINTFVESFSNVSLLTEKVEDGEVVDLPTLMLELSKMILSYQFTEQFLMHEEKKLDISSIELGNDVEKKEGYSYIKELIKK